MGKEKLRLLVTSQCPNKCPMCCNNSWDFSKLPVVEHFNYKEVMITGGEPLLFLDKVAILADSIKNSNKLAYSNDVRGFIYTALADDILNILPRVDGVVFTPHSEKDIESFLKANRIMGLFPETVINKSLRLNLFSNMKSLIPESTDLSHWQVKDIIWIKDCPVPPDEEFKRVDKLWEKI